MEAERKKKPTQQNISLFVFIIKASPKVVLIPQKGEALSRGDAVLSLENILDFYI